MKSTGAAVADILKWMNIPRRPAIFNARSLRQRLNSGPVGDSQIGRRQQGCANQGHAPGVLDYLDGNDLVHPVDNAM